MPNLFFLGIANATHNKQKAGFNNAILCLISALLLHVCFKSSKNAIKTKLFFCKNEPIIANLTTIKLSNCFYVMLYTIDYASPLGKLWISSNNDAITALDFEDTLKGSALLNSTPHSQLPQVLREAIAQLTAYFAQQLQAFDLPLQAQGTPFQQRVWRELQAVGYGKTATYSYIAQQLGDTKAVRAVGTANGSNPIAIIIPCHRIIGSNGALTGYAGGLWRKQWLLNHEHSHKTLLLFD